MKIIENVIMALKALGSNKVRTFLTMLGVIIGVFAVIVLVSMGEGAKAYIHASISSFGEGTNYLEVRAWQEGEGPFGTLSMLDSKLTYKDAIAIKEKSKYLKYIDPRIIRKGEVGYGRITHKIPFVFGVSPDYVYVFTHAVKDGRFFSEADIAEQKKVMVLGPTVAQKLFGGLSPVGERIKLKGYFFTVIGVFTKKGTMVGFDYDDIVAIPITAAEELYNTDSVIEMGMSAIKEDDIEKLKAEVENILLIRHGKKDFRVDTQEESLDLLNGILGILTGVVGGIAAISLLVGSIGIMNIMLVSVTERTREIGIRKAIGAKRNDIFTQFVVEATVISFIGGTIGIVLGIIASLTIMYFLNLPLTVSVWSVFLACTVSVIIGIFSGVYPAIRAGNLNPVEALRYE
ncbi:hypothetical protein A3J90_00995 [candidate division WOR-1 bacterium RIFOXYC2_FULL_37_10]|uniref:Multidrug ABC transporter substrate-binding protein n=1 Tax=candidate division WOR-1 bacterium RIFOXYB2_FULL_37_13 TaxID=1802579 RepID=A0A1F4STP5_UNCSA|nr:MAG: hypothetical protein A2246_04235 [candidate division WOR-1 bacterium RIFOXYA2_FULL_37_7]OGC23815.1 MAG: hypothetical protein A2310_04280 [candidate division WOR-1 bacterium RIFOXYB2_FULL_37_13]OGC33285.1 MAG: hypothetical protein A3J90_00995 [candidate division WOR-1 bacterium RIFOXYC2_FULL_37_10]